MQVAGTRPLGTANMYRMRARLYGKFILHERSPSPTTVTAIIFSISSAIQQTPAFRTVICFGLTDTDADATMVSSQEIMSNTELRREIEELKQQVKERNAAIASFRAQVDDLKQYTHRSK